MPIPRRARIRRIILAMAVATTALPVTGSSAAIEDSPRFSVEPQSTLIDTPSGLRITLSANDGEEPFRRHEIKISPGWRFAFASMRSSETLSSCNDVPSPTPTSDNYPIDDMEAVGYASLLVATDEHRNTAPTAPGTEGTFAQDNPAFPTGRRDALYNGAGRITASDGAPLRSEAAALWFLRWSSDTKTAVVCGRVATSATRDMGGAVIPPEHRVIVFQLTFKLRPDSWLVTFDFDAVPGAPAGHRSITDNQFFLDQHATITDLALNLSGLSAGNYNIDPATGKRCPFVLDSGAASQAAPTSCGNSCDPCRIATSVTPDEPTNVEFMGEFFPCRLSQPCVSPPTRRFSFPRSVDPLGSDVSIIPVAHAGTISAVLRWNNGSLTNQTHLALSLIDPNGRVVAEDNLGVQPLTLSHPVDSSGPFGEYSLRVRSMDHGTNYFLSGETPAPTDMSSRVREIAILIRPDLDPYIHHAASLMGPTTSGLDPRWGLIRGTSQVTFTWRQPLVGGDERLRGYVLAIAEPNNEDTLHFEYIIIDTTAPDVDPRLPCGIDGDEETCSLSLTFPLSTEASRPLGEDGIYDIALITIYANGNRTDGRCDVPGDPLGIECTPDRAGFKVAPWPSTSLDHNPRAPHHGISIRHLILREKAWPAAYAQTGDYLILLVDFALRQGEIIDLGGSDVPTPKVTDRTAQSSTTIIGDNPTGGLVSFGSPSPFGHQVKWRVDMVALPSMATGTFILYDTKGFPGAIPPGGLPGVDQGTLWVRTFTGNRIA